MKFLAVTALALFVASASAMPRYLVVPLEDVEFEQPMRMRYRREVESEDAVPVPMYLAKPPSPVMAQRRQDVAVPVVVPEGAVRFSDALGKAGFPTARDSLASGSSYPSAHISEPDYVDYGAYTGKGGAFGWYSDHPVLVFSHAGYH